MVSLFVKNQIRLFHAADLSLCHSVQRVPNPPFDEEPLYIYILPLPLTLFVALFLWLEGWLGQIWWVFFYLTTWIYTCLGTLVPEGSLMCFMQQRLSLVQYNAWDGFLLVTWFDNTHTHTHKHKRKQLTQGLVDWHTHKSIY